MRQGLHCAPQRQYAARTSGGYPTDKFCDCLSPATSDKAWRKWPKEPFSTSLCHRCRSRAGRDRQVLSGGERSISAVDAVNRRCFFTQRIDQPVRDRYSSATGSALDAIKRRLDRPGGPGLDRAAQNTRENSMAQTSAAASVQPHNQRPAAIWSSGGADYDRISRGIADLIEHCVLRLDPQPGERVLDLATGTGWTSRRVANCGSIVVGADIATDMLAAAARWKPRSS